MQIETVASKSPWRNIHSQEPRAPKSCSIWAPIRAPKSCSIRVPDSAPEKSYTIRAPKRWLVDTKTVASKEPLEKHAQPRAPGLEKLFDYRALIRAPKRCSIRVPDSGPEKSYTIRAPKEWLVDTNVQIETVASKEPLEKHPQPRAPGPEKLFDSGPDSGPEKLFHSGPGFGPRKGPRFGLRKVVYHSGPGFGPRKDVPFGPRVQALNCFQAGKLAPKTCSKFGPGSGPEVATEGARDSGAMAACPD